MTHHSETARPCAYAGYIMGGRCCRGGPLRFVCKRRKSSGRAPHQSLFWRLRDKWFAKRMVAGLVVAWMSNGAIHYDLSQLPTDAEARIACCANGPSEDGSCVIPPHPRSVRLSATSE